MTDDPERIGLTARAVAAAARPRTGQPQRPPAPRDPALADALADHAEARAAARDVEWQRTIPRRFQPARLADFAGRPVGDELAAWAAQPEPPNLVLFGPTGVGKSHAAIAALRARFEMGARVRFTPSVELLESIDWRRPDGHDQLAAACSVAVLAVDDLGAERTTEWTTERLYLIVNRRELDMLPLVVTTNADLGDDTARGTLVDRIGERTWSRIVGGACVLRVAGDDRRRQR